MPPMQQVKRQCERNLKVASKWKFKETFANQFVLLKLVNLSSIQNNWWASAMSKANRNGGRLSKVQNISYYLYMVFSYCYAYSRISRLSSTIDLERHNFYTFQIAIVCVPNFMLHSIQVPLLHIGFSRFFGFSSHLSSSFLYTKCTKSPPVFIWP